MKIAIIHFYLATASGDPRMALSIAQELQKEGHTVKVYCAESDSRFLPDLRKGLDIEVVPPRAPLASVLGASGMFARVGERLRRRRLYADTARRIEAALEPDFDFVLCENDYSYQVGITYKKRNPRARVVWIMNNPPFYHSRKNHILIDTLSRGSAWLEARTAKKFASGIDWAVVYDKKDQDASLAVGIYAKLVGNPLDFNYFYYPVRLWPTSGPVRILAVGVLSPFRRFEDVISAVKILRGQKYDVRALIICKDYWADKSYYSHFTTFIKSSGVGEYIDVRFEGVSEEFMLQALRESHLSLVPNNAKVWVATACEAMAAGMPLVISRATAMTGVLRDGEDALFFDPLRVDQITEKIKLLIEKPDLYARIARNGQAFVKNNLDFKSFVKAMLQPPVGTESFYRENVFRNMIKKVTRLTQEFFFALVFYKNPWAYYAERLQLSRGDKMLLMLRNGIAYSLHANTNEIRMVNEAWNVKVYDPLLDNIRDGSIIVDIGASVGVFSMKAACVAKNVTVFSYEPFPQSFAALKDNVTLNNLQKFVVPVNKAVAGTRGELELFFRANDPGGVSIYQYGDTTQLHSIKVLAVTLEDIFRENKIEACDFLKIDCEGAEEAIIMNAPKNLFNLIRSITLEWHYDLNKMSVGEFRKFLENLSYVTRYDPSTLTLYAWKK